MPENNKLIARPNYGPRRAVSASSEFSLDQEAIANIPMNADILLNVGLGRKRLHLQAGSGADINSERNLLYGSTSSRFNHTHYTPSFNGLPSTLLAKAYMLRIATPAGFDASSVFVNGSLFDTITSGVQMIDSLIPCDTGVAGYGGWFTGVGDVYADGANLTVGNRITDTLRLQTIDMAGAADQQRVLTVSQAASIPYYYTGRDHLGRTVRGLFMPSIDGESVLNSMSPVQLEGAMKHMIISPDEWLMRHDNLLEQFMRNLHNMSADQLQYHLRKGFKGNFFDRLHDDELVLMGKLAHLGASLRVGMPVRNCYSSIYRAPVENTNTVINLTVGDEEYTFTRAGASRGMSFAREVVQGVNNIDASIQEWFNEEIVGTDLPGTQIPITEEMFAGLAGADTSSAINPVVGGHTITLAVHNASVNDFFVYVDDYSCQVSTNENVQGLFCAIPQLAEMLAPGLYEMPQDPDAIRDYIWADFVRGLEFVLSNCSADQASSYSTYMRWVRENFTDFKTGAMPDVYSSEARKDATTIRHGWNMNLQNLSNSGPQSGGLALANADLNRGVSGAVQATAMNVGNIGRFYAAGFIDTNAVDMFKNEVETLARNDYIVGGDFTRGLQLVGDASYSTHHRTEFDGTEYAVDCKISPCAYGHWASIPIQWTAGGQIYQWRTSADGDDLTLSCFASNAFTGTNQFSMASLLSDVTVVANALTHQKSATGTTHVAALSYVFPAPLVFERDENDDESAQTPTGLRPLQWRDLTPQCDMPVWDFPGLSATELAAGIHFGNDRHGLFRQTADLVRNNDAAALSGDSLFYLFNDLDRLSLSPVAQWTGWYDKLTITLRNMSNSVNHAPFGNEGIKMGTEGVNLVAMASYSTGEPALQQMGDAIFTIAFCGRNSGWSIEQRSVDRRLHDIELHQYANILGYDAVDYAGMIVPAEMDPSKLLTAFSAANIVCYQLGLVGAGQAHRPGESRSYHIDYGAVRTIYRSEASRNGEVIEHSITPWLGAFQYYNENVLQDYTANGTIINQLQCQPGARKFRRLFTFMNPAQQHGAGNSVCALLGLTAAPLADGSSVEGLEGYSGEVSNSLLRVLHRQGTATMVASGLDPITFMEDGTSTEPAGYGYWSTSQAGSNGDALREGDYINSNFVRVMVERNRGIDSLRYREVAPRIMMFDQDLFDHYTAVRSCMKYEYDRKMYVGPCPHLLVYGHDGQVLIDQRNVDVTEVGAGQSAAASSGSAPKASSYDSGDDRSAVAGSESSDDDDSDNES